MGNCNSNSNSDSNSTAITINVDRSNMFYFTGELVSGTVVLNIIQGKIEADEIYIQLTGETGYTTTQTVSNGDDQTTMQTQYHDIKFHSAKIILVRPKLGQKELVFSQGQYSWPFQIPLTDYLPPTMNQPQAYPHVRYYLQVIIDKPWYKPNTRETRYITVFPRVNLLHIPQCLQSTVFGNQNRKDIAVKGTLNKLGYVPGELVHITLEIENPRRVLIKLINLSILQSYRIGQSSSGTTIFQTTLPNILNLKNQEIRQTFSIVIPSMPIPPSYVFQGGLQTAAFVSICYILRFSVKVAGMFTNFNVDIPITMGTEPNPDINQQQIFNPMVMSDASNPEQSMFSGDATPNYDSVMQNSK